MADGADIGIRVLRSTAEIESIRALWLDLCRERDADPDFFLHIVSISPDASPYVLLLERGERSGLLVGRIETSKLRIGVGALRVPSPRVRILEFTGGGSLGEIGPAEAAVVRAHLGAMLRRGEVDVVRLHFADPSSALYVECARLSGFFTRDRAVQPISYWTRRLDGGGTTFLASISAKHRSAHRRHERRLLAEFSGAVRIDRFHDVASLTQLLTDAEHIARRSYQRRIGVGFRDDEIMRRRLKLLAEKGWLRAWLLYFSDRPAALWIGALREGKFLLDYMAYDAALAPLAPGTYLGMKVLEELQNPQSGVRVVDFGPGEAFYKERFGTDKREVATLHIYAATWKGVSTSAMRTGAAAATGAAKALLLRLGALDRIKRRLRRTPTETEKAAI